MFGYAPRINNINAPPKKANATHEIRNPTKSTSSCVHPLFVILSKKITICGNYMNPKIIVSVPL